MTAAAPMTAPTSAARKSRPNVVLAMLLVVYIFNFIDRQILSILLESIKQDIELSDTQLGFLGGIAFALFYATAVFPSKFERVS